MWPVFRTPAGNCSWNSCVKTVPRASRFYAGVNMQAAELSIYGFIYEIMCSEGKRICERMTKRMQIVMWKESKQDIKVSQVTFRSHVEKGGPKSDVSTNQDHKWTELKRSYSAWLGPITLSWKNRSGSHINKTCMIWATLACSVDLALEVYKRKRGQVRDYKPK